MFSSHAKSFAGLDVVEYEGPKSWRGPAVAYRVRIDYEEPATIGSKLEPLLAHPEASQLQALVIGAWPETGVGSDSSETVSALAGLAPRLPKLRALFLGDIVVEESEVSWITQSNVSPLLSAYPQLDTFQVRGGNNLSFSSISHPNLRQLTIESGGLSRVTIREVFLNDFPNLEHLELMLGEEHYGFDGGVADLQPVLSGSLYSRLRYLGLRNSHIADDIAAIVVNSPIVRRIEVLDLSLGNMTEQGARSLMMLPTDGRLKRLDISHHYVPEEVVDALRAKLPFEVIAEDRQEPDDEWRSIAHAE
ncbi:MAG: STM4015 family protein [Planctomycetia bacterium]|nr:STM4015 family protein [Planctomycetia bacterium]